jgi:UDP-N-acetyl-2-amino-2-deoxyglucuronate dehydrogenase
VGVWNMKKLNLGIVGCGDIAGFTALVSRLVPQVRLVACCDVNASRAQTYAHRHRIPQVYTDYTELLVEADLDAIYLAVPHNLHFEMILSAVEAGKPVFVEKPVTRTLEEGKKLVKTVTNRKVGVNYQYRYDRGCYALGRAVQAGSLGKIHSIRINIPWHRTQSYFNGAAWHKTTAQAGGGTLITQGSHFLDVALWMMAEQPVSAMGYTASPGFEVEVDTLAHGIIETSGGTLINITSSMVAASEQTVTIEVYGERGTALYRDLPLPSVKFVGIKVRTERPPEWGVHALQRSLAGFANWVLMDRPYLIPAHEALPVLAAVDGIYRSAQSGKREKVEF